MVKCLIILLLSCLISSLSSNLWAHTVWTGLDKPEPGVAAVAILGVGRYFPEQEDLAAETILNNYEPLRLHGKDGEIELKPYNKPTLAISEKPLAAGSYIVTTTMRPSFLSKTEDGQRIWKSKPEVPGAVSCDTLARYAKGLVEIGGERNDALVTKPVGQKLELLPTTNPSLTKVGDKLTIVLLFDGGPLQNARVEGTFAGYADGKALAFSSRTDKEGRFVFIPLKEGFWMLKAFHELPYKDSTVCDIDRYEASITFSIP